MEKMVFVQQTERIKQDLIALSQLTDQTQPGYTRRAFTDIYNEGRSWLVHQMEACGLDVHQDAASNVIGTLAGKNKDLPPIMIGSHIDTVTGGGMFDGTIGVIAGLEIVRQLRERGIQLEHTLLIVDFTAEESSDFGMATIGSRGMVNNLPEVMLNQRDPSGITLRESLENVGGRPDDLADEALKQSDLSLYMELHIEQGPVLERTNNELGIVTGIVGNQRYEIDVIGQPNHSGTTPMNARADALTAASEIILEVERLANQSYEEVVVGTVGKLVNEPNGTNVVPGRVVFDAEFRSLSLPIIEQLFHDLGAFIQDVETRRDVTIQMKQLSQSEPVIIDDWVIEGVERGCLSVGKSIRLPSGAGHDGNQLTRITDVGMIFVPSKDGKSHCPEEWTDYEAVAKGVQALGNAVVNFDEKARQ